MNPSDKNTTDTDADILSSSALAGTKKRKGAGGGDATSPKSSRITAEPRQKKRRGLGGLLLHDFAVSFRQLLPVMLVALVFFIVAMAVSTAAIPDTSIFNLDYTHDQMKFRFWAEDLNLVVVLGTALFGFIAGMRAFRFLLVKCESTAVLSLPLPRSSVFATRILACLLCLIIGIGIPLLISLCVNIIALDVWAGLIGSFFYVLAGLLLTALVACAVAVIGCTLAGSIIEAGAFALALLASVTAVLWGLNVVMDYMLVGNPFGETLLGSTTEITPSLLTSAAFLNPLTFFADEAAAHQVFIVQHPIYEPLPGNALLLVLWFVVALVLLALALIGINRRKGEKAGIAGLNMAISVVIGIVVGLFAFGITFTLLASLNVPTAIIAAFVVLWIISLILLRGPLKGHAGWGRTLITLGAETVVLACVVAIVGTGAFGFSQRVPATDDVQRVQVSYTGSPSYLASPFESATAGSGPYYYSAEYSFTDDDAIDIVRGVHENLVGTGGQTLGADTLDFSASVVPYDVVIRYTLADGGEQVRYYDRATYAELATLTELDDTSEVPELTRAVITGDISMLDEDAVDSVSASSARQAYAVGDIYITDPLYTEPMLLNCDADARNELLLAIAADVSKQDAADRYHPSDSCKGVVMFTQSGDTAADTFAYGLENAIVYLTDEFTETLAWFASNGLTEYLDDRGAAYVESMTFQRYAPFEGMNEVTDPTSIYFMGYAATSDTEYVAMMDWGTKYTTEKQKEISELLPLCRNTYYMDEGGYLICAKLKGQERYSYLFIPQDSAPEWLVRVVG